MTDDFTEVRSGFVRQRRSLIITSLVLLAFQQTGASIGVLNVLGNSIELSKPLALTTPLWIAWAYFLVRYYQHFRDLEDRGLYTSYRERLFELVKRQALSVLRNTFELPFDDIENVDKVTFDVTSDEVASTPPPWRFKLSGSVSFRQRKPSTKFVNQQFSDYLVEVSRSHMIIPHLRSVWWVVFHTRLATEYMLPFVIAAAPCAVVLLRVIKTLAA